MGIMRNKVTRRVAIGSVVGLAAAPLVFRALKGRYEVNMPDRASARTVGGTIVTDYRGKTITLEVPRMQLRTPEDQKNFESLVLEQIKKNPTVVEVDKLEFEKWIETNKKNGMAQLDRWEKKDLEEIAMGSGGEEGKRVAAKEIKEVMQACRNYYTEFLASRKRPPL